MPPRNSFYCEKNAFIIQPEKNNKILKSFRTKKLHITNN